MSPGELTGIMAIAAILEKIGTWPILSLLLGFAAIPWLGIVYITRSQEKRIQVSLLAQEELISDAKQRFIEMKAMYENNVILVKNYEKTSENLEKLIDGLFDLISLNTAKWSEVCQKIDTNQFCPAHRTTKVKSEDVR